MVFKFNLKIFVGFLIFLLTINFFANGPFFGIKNFNSEKTENEKSILKNRLDHLIKNGEESTKPTSPQTTTSLNSSIPTIKQSQSSLIPSAEEILKINNFYNSIFRNDFKITSQNGEDGVIESLIQFLNITYPGEYVEFGTENGNECNTRQLREKLNWKGLLMDGSNENLSINLHKETILHSNILDLFAKYNVSDDLDIFSEDTDYGDYWIVDKVLTKYHPKIVIHEVNQKEPEFCVTVPKSDSLIYWDSSDYHGGSVCAFYCLAKRFNYTMVYCEKAGVNCFWIRNDLLEKGLNIDSRIVQKHLTPKFLFKKPGFVYRFGPGPWKQIVCDI